MSISSLSIVHIEGDKSNFVSKSAVDRFKNDLKFADGANEVVLASSYLKEGWTYEVIEQTETMMRVRIVEEKNDGKDKGKLSSLRNKIREKRMKRLSDSSISHSLQTQANKGKDKGKEIIIPSSLAETYARLKKMGNQPLINPVDVLNNMEETKKMLEQMFTVQKGPSNPYTEYYRDMLNWLKSL